MANWRILKWMNLVAGLAGLLLASVVLAPQVMAWPYKAKFGTTLVYAEQPISPNMAAIIAKADRLTQASAIYNRNGYATDVFLTDGGWRWKLTSLSLGGSFAFTRPVNNAIMVNLANVDADRIDRQGKPRSLASIIAHERTHGLIRHRFGLLAGLRFSSRNVEGYCDYVAEESTLDAAEYARFKRNGEKRHAMLYYEGHQAAIDALGDKKMSVEQFLESSPN